MKSFNELRERMPEERVLRNKEQAETELAVDRILGIVSEHTEDVEPVRVLPELEDNITIPVDPLMRAKAVAKFRSLADQLERGELRGARVQWREGCDYIEFVELDERAREVRFRRTYKE